MLFQIFSDIHLELLNKKFSISSKFPVVADYLILAGDIGKVSDVNFKTFIDFCSSSYKKVFYVLGNHEFYSSHSMTKIKQKFSKFFSNYSNVYLLDNSFHQIDDYTIYGFTCWTRPIFDRTSLAKEYLNDYNKIKTNRGKFTVDDHRDLAEDEIARFKEFYHLYDSNKLIVVTHFPPVSSHKNDDLDLSENLDENNSKKFTTSDPIYLGDFMNEYFAWKNIFKSEEISTDKIKCWISGHTHWSYDFMYQNIRLYSNQVGYLNEGVKSSDGIFEV